KCDHIYRFNVIPEFPTRGIAEALPRNRRACMTLAEAAGPAHAHLSGSGGTGGAVHRTHRSPTGRAAPGHRSRLLRSLGADLRQGLPEPGHRRLESPVTVMRSHL